MAGRRRGAGSHGGASAGARRRAVALLVLGTLLLGVGGGRLSAQQAPKKATEVADEYLRGIEAMAWRATAQRIHPRALERLRTLLRIMTEDDKTGRLLEALGDGLSQEAYLSQDGQTLFVSVMNALLRESPGIINAMTARDTQVLGSVAEGDSLRHVVYRLKWRLQGAEAEIKVMTLAKDSRGRWRVLDAPELESLRSALMGIVLERPPPGAASPDEPTGPDTTTPNGSDPP